MKNIEKYPNTNDALEAWKNVEGAMPFSLWLEREHVAPREPTLLEAAEKICNVLYHIRMNVGSSTTLSYSEVDELKAVVDREKRKPMRNGDVYKTAEEMRKAFDKWCMKRECKASSCQICLFKWLYAEADKANEAGKEAK